MLAGLVLMTIGSLIAGVPNPFAPMLLLKNTGFGAISFDLGFLAVFSIVAMTSATLLFKRTL